MAKYSTSELRKLVIINVCDGSRLGYASDFEFEANGDCTRVLSLIVCGSPGFFGFGGEDDLVIPWCKVQCIGEDAILVHMTPQEFSGCLCSHKRSGKRRFGE